MPRTTRIWYYFIANKYYETNQATVVECEVQTGQGYVTLCFALGPTNWRAVTRYKTGLWAVKAEFWGQYCWESVAPKARRRETSFPRGLRPESNLRPVSPLAPMILRCVMRYFCAKITNQRTLALRVTVCTSHSTTVVVGNFPRKHKIDEHNQGFE